MEPTRRRDSGKLPEFGAIFMSNTKTRGECFNRSLFALPFASAEFVRQVRAGMVLFLFDYQERRLYGVFEAVSDGGFNIVPHAYTSSRQSFPAQVRFRIIWKCIPLREREFQDAIRDNYYAKQKFNFGLSKDQVRRLLYLFEPRRVKIKKSPNVVKIKKRHSEHSGGMQIRDDASDNEHSGGKKIRDSDASDKERSGGKNIRDSDASDNQKISVEPLEEEEFIPLSSPGSSGSSASQSSPFRSKDQNLPEYHPKVKGLYSDRIEERKSAFARLEKCNSTMDGTKRTIGHLDKYANVYPCKDLEIERRRSYADVETLKGIMGNLSIREKSWRKKNQKGRNHVHRKRETPKLANVFPRSNFDSENDKLEKETSKGKEQKRDHGGCDKYYGHAEKNRFTILLDSARHRLFRRGMQEEKPILNVKLEGKTHREIGGKRCNYSPVRKKRDRGGCDKYYGHAEKNRLTIPVDSTKHRLFCRGMQEEKPIMNVEPEGKTDREIGGKRCNYSPVSSCLSDMRQKKRKLVMETPSAELDIDFLRDSNLDDQVQLHEYSLVSIKSESFQLSPSNISSKFDAMKYLENIRDQSQGEKKCEEKDMLLSWESEMIEIIDNHMRCLEDIATMVSSLAVDDDDKVRNIEDKLGNSSNLNSA